MTARRLLGWVLLTCAAIGFVCLIASRAPQGITPETFLIALGAIVVFFAGMISIIFCIGWCFSGEKQ